jgi:transcriptional regulator with XRE-family HTH domain
MKAFQQKQPSVSIELASRLKALRQQQGLSLADVATGTGLSASFISLIENGKSDITFSRLYRLVQFYGIGLTDLAPNRESSLSIVRAGEERRIYSPAEGIEVVLLVADTTRLMLPMLVTYQPGAEMSELAKHEGEDFLHVTEGCFLLEIEGSESVILEKGDSAYYSAAVPHKQRNLSTSISSFFGVMTPPML